jgi:hypothetical protein
MEEELDEFGIPIKKPAEEAKPVKAKAQKVEVDEFGIPIKKKEGTTQDSGQPVQPSAQSGGPDQASIDRQKTLLYQIKKAHKDFIKESEQALNDGWDVDYTKKYFADKQNYLAAMLDELDNLGGDQVRQWTGGMRSAIDNSKQNVIKQRDSWFSDPENLYQEDRGNQEWFNINTKEIEGILSGRQVNRPKEGLPEIKAPKKQVLSGEVPSLREIVQKPQEEMFKPEKDDYNADRLKLAVHQEARDKYKELAKFTTNVNLSIDQNADVTYNGAEIDYNLLIQNEDVWKKYVGEDLPWPGGVYEPNPQKRADIKKEAERRIKEKLASANELVEQSIDSKVIKDIVDKNFNENTYAHFLTTSGDRIGFKVTQPVVDVNKISEQVDKIVEHYGLDPKGSVAIDLYDKAVSTVQYESDRYRIDEKFKEEFPEEYNLREKYKSGKFQEEINAKFISELESTYSLYESQANEEIGSIYGAAKKQAETLSVQYNQQVDEFKRQAEELGRAYQNNEIDELTYQDALGKINGQLSELSEAFKAMLPNQDELNAQANKIYSRYNTEFERKRPL